MHLYFLILCLWSTCKTNDKPDYTLNISAFTHHKSFIYDLSVKALKSTVVA